MTPRGLQHGIGLAMLLLAPAFCACAHDVHQSRAEAEYNAGSRRLEVSLTVFVDDLELALTRQAEHRISITNTPAPDIDSQLQRFLAANFIVTDAGGKAAELHWVGRRLDPDSAKSAEPELTLFFEVSLPEGLQGSSLRHIAFCDRFQDQCNLLHLRTGGQDNQLKFTRDTPVQPLSGDD